MRRSGVRLSSPAPILLLARILGLLGAIASAMVSYNLTEP